MPNSLVAEYLAQNPKDPRSEQDLTLLLGDELGAQAERYPDFYQEYRELDLQRRERNQPSLFEEMGRGLSRGTDVAQANLFGALESGAQLASPILPSRFADYLKRIGHEGYQRNIEESQQNPATIQTVEEAKTSPSRFLRFAAGQVGEQGPQLGGAMLAGTAGGLAGGPAGSLAGVGAWSYAQNQNYEDLINQGVDPDVAAKTSTVAGLAAGSFDTILPAKLLGKFRGMFEGVEKEAAKVGGKIGKQAAEGTVIQRYIKRAAKDVPVNALLEGSTEALQELIAIGSEYWAHRDDPNFDIPKEEVYSRLLNNGVPGALLGGVTGPFEALSTPGHGKPATTETSPPPPGTGEQPYGSAANPVRTPPGPTQDITTEVNKQPIYDLTPEQQQELSDIAMRDLAGTATMSDAATLRALPLELQRAYIVLHQQIAEGMRADAEQAAAAEPVDTTPGLGTALESGGTTPIDEAIAAGRAPQPTPEPAAPTFLGPEDFRFDGMQGVGVPGVAPQHQITILRDIGELKAGGTYTAESLAEAGYIIPPAILRLATGPITALGLLVTWASAFSWVRFVLA